MTAGFIWVDLPGSGGYTHLINACARWLFRLEGEKDCEVPQEGGQDAAGPLTIPATV